MVGGAADGRRKRPFQLTAHDELQLQLQLQLDELCGLEDYELHGPQQERTTKRRLTAEQVRELELSFEEEKRKLEPRSGASSIQMRPLWASTIALAM